MQNIRSSAELKAAIIKLELEQIIIEQLIKQQVKTIYSSFKPLNIIKNAFKDISTSPNLIENVIGTTVGLASGYLSKKIVVGKSGNIFRKLIGTLTQVGVTKIVANHPETIKSIGQFIIGHLFSKKQKIKTDDNM